MPNFASWESLVAEWKAKRWAYTHPSAKIITFDQIPTYLRAVIPLTLTDEIQSGAIHAFNFEVETPAPENVVQNALESARNQIAETASSKYNYYIAQMYLYHTPTRVGKRYAGGKVYSVGILGVTAPLMLATGLRLGAVGQFLADAAYYVTNAIRNRGYLAVADFTSADYNYHASRIELTEGVITSGEILGLMGPGPTTPTLPKEDKEPKHNQEKLKWLLVGAGVVLLIVLMLRK